MKQRKMAFYEIGMGKLALDVQKSFEDIQRAVQEVGAKGTVTLNIHVSPANGKEPFGKVSFDVQKKYPKESSAEYTTQLNGAGLITKTGESIIDVLQEDLFLPDEPKVINFNKEG